MNDEGEFRTPRPEETFHPAVISATSAKYRVDIIDVETGVTYTTELNEQGAIVLPKTEDAYRLLPVFRALARRAQDYTKHLTQICLEDLAALTATERRVEGRLYRLEQDGEWDVNGEQMHSELTACVAAGLLTEKERDEAVRKEITVKWKTNNTVLNGLAKRRGGRVAEAVNKFRKRVLGAPKVVEVL